MNIGAAGLKDSIQVGGSTFTDLTNLKMIECLCGPNNFTSATGYQVPAGKSLYVYAVQVALTNALVATADLALGYGDTQVSGSVAGPTNNVNVVRSGGYSNSFVIPCFCIIPAQKYPYGYCSTAGTSFRLYAFGYER